MIGRFLIAVAALISPLSSALAQGQDSTPSERDILVIAALLPGHYNNANQSYFDVRLKRPEAERHSFAEMMVSQVEADKLGAHVFTARQTTGDATAHLLYTLSVDNEARAVRMKTYRLEKAPAKKIKTRDAAYVEGCDLLWRQEAGQYRGALEGNSCSIKGSPAGASYEMLLTPDALWHRGANKAPGYHALDRSREFECYIDVPGVGGGRDIPYERLELGTIHDLGGEVWAETKDGMEIGVNLFRVMWPMNNYVGIFARPSFVIYVKTKDEDGKPKEVGYSFTSPDAERLGINLKWALASCYMLSNKSIDPFFKNNEPKVAPR